MKAIFINAMLTAFILLTACDQKTTADTTKENDSLRVVINEQATSINDFITSFNAVESNLNTITSKQHIIITSAEGDLKTKQMSRINEEIKSINLLMDKNSKEIDELNSKLNGSAIKNTELKKTIAILTNQLTIKYAELNDLNNKLNLLNADVDILLTRIDTLIAENDAAKNTLTETINNSHTAYYIIGKTKYLRDEKLIDSKGGLLGIGATSTLSKDFDKAKFTRIDYTQISGFPINSSAVKLITSHPADSYTFDRDELKKKMIKNLVIINPEKFWSLSKYLIIAND